MKCTTRRGRLLIVGSLALGSLFVVGCQNEVPQKTMPGGILSGSDYERMHAKQRGTMSPAMQESIAKAHATPTTRAATTTPAVLSPTASPAPASTP